MGVALHFQSPGSIPNLTHCTFKSDARLRAEWYSGIEPIGTPESYNARMQSLSIKFQTFNRLLLGVLLGPSWMQRSWDTTWSSLGYNLLSKSQVVWLKWKKNIPVYLYFTLLHPMFADHHLSLMNLNPSYYPIISITMVMSLANTTLVLPYFPRVFQDHTNLSSDILVGTCWNRTIWVGFCSLKKKPSLNFTHWWFPGEIPELWWDWLSHTAEFLTLKSTQIFEFLVWHSHEFLVESRFSA